MKQRPQDPQSGLIDPILKPWVWAIFGALFALMPPIWPFSGVWAGIPIWALFAVFISFLTSLFTLIVIFWIWRDPDSERNSSQKSQIKPPSYE